jgi:AcrR family transcriptional regulator
MTPAELLAIARRLIEEGGLDALTMDRLAEAAGISRSSAYRLVGGRDALLEWLAAEGVDVGERGDVRARILAAARDVFARQGLDAATVDAIAAAAGVGTATVYRHFGDKRGLIDAFVDTMTPRKTAWATARAPSGDLARDLGRLARAVLEHVATHEALVRLVLLEQLRGSTILGELSASEDRTIHGLAALMRHYIARGELVAEDPYRLARAFQGMLIGFGLFGTLWALPGTGDPERDAELVVALFLRGAQRGVR